MPTVEPALAIADALVNELNCTKFSREFQAARSYTPKRELAGTPKLAVDVMLADMDTSISTRGEDDETHTIAVAFHQRLDNTSNATVDPLISLVREVHDHCRKLQLAGARVIGRKMKPRYDLDEMIEHKAFVAFLFLEFKLLYDPEAGQ